MTDKQYGRMVVILNKEVERQLEYEDNFSTPKQYNEALVDLLDNLLLDSQMKHCTENAIAPAKFFGALLKK